MSNNTQPQIPAEAVEYIADQIRQVVTSASNVALFMAEVIRKAVNGASGIYIDNAMKDAVYHFEQLKAVMNHKGSETHQEPPATGEQWVKATDTVTVKMVNMNEVEKLQQLAISLRLKGDRLVSLLQGVNVKGADEAIMDWLEKKEEKEHWSRFMPTATVLTPCSDKSCPYCHGTGKIRPSLGRRY